MQPTEIRFTRNGGMNNTLWRTRFGLRVTLPIPNTGTIVWLGSVTNMCVSCVNEVKTLKRLHYKKNKNSVL